MSVLRQSAMDSLTADQTPSYELHKVFSTSLNAATTWFALNSNLCSTKASTFCSSSTAKLFHSEYACVRFADLRGEDGFPARSKWFSAKGYAEDVFIVTAFGILLGILRLSSRWKGAHLSGRSIFFHMFVLSIPICLRVK